MEDALVDESLQRRIQIVSLLKSGGWKMFTEKLQDLRACYSADIQLLMTDAVNVEKLALLNMKLGRLQALHAVLAIQDELVEEITPDDGETPSDEK